MAASSNNETISYSVISGALPTGLTLSSTGQVSGSPANVNGGFTFTVRALDADSYADRTFTTNVVAKVIAWTTAASQTFFTGHTSTNFAATTSTGNMLVYSIPTGSLPTGLTLSANGTVAGKATAAGTFTFTVRATDGHVFADRVFTFSVTADTIVWVSNTAVLATLNGGVPVSTMLQANSAAGDPVTYSIASGTLPPGLSLTNSVISGTPSNLSGLYSYTVAATDGTATANLAYTSNVVAAVVTWVSNAALPTTMLGSVFSQTLTATTTAPRPVTYSLLSGTIPSGLALSPSTGVLSGTTTGNSVSAVFTVRASDGVGFADKAFSLYVNGPPVWKTPAGALGNVVFNAPFSITLSANDPDGIASYSQVGGDNLGNGVTLAASGNSAIFSGAFPFFDPNSPTWISNASLGTQNRGNTVSFALNAAAIPGRTITSYSLANSTYIPAGLQLTQNTGVITGTVDLFAKDYNEVAVSPYTPPTWVTQSNLGVLYIGNAITLNLNANPKAGNSAVYYTMSSSDIIPFGLYLNANGAVTGMIDKTNVASEAPASAPPPIWNTASGTLGAYDNNQLSTTHVVATPGFSVTPQFGNSVAVYAILSPTTLPDGLYMTATTGVISGTIPATAASGDTASVLPGPTWNTASGSLGNSTNNQAVTLNLSVSPKPNTQVAYTVVSGGLPNGTMLATANAITGAGTITGTLDGNATATSTTLGNARTFAFTLRAIANTGGYTDQSFTYTINVT
jgi:hypothetical protein